MKGGGYSLSNYGIGNQDPGPRTGIVKPTGGKGEGKGKDYSRKFVDENVTLNAGINNADSEPSFFKGVTIM